MDEILESLNPAQKQAVLHFDSPLLLIAGAGSGKTKVITTKIAYLIKKKDYAPYNILGVTFTNKAASEMKSRIQDMTGIDGKSFNISTFHSLGLRILREGGKTAGFDGDWQIIDDSDQKKIFNNIIKENFSHFTNDMRDDVKRKIGFAKMDLNYPNNRDYLLQRGFSDDELRIYTLYYAYQKKNKVWDYEDLISLPVKMLQNNDELLEKYRAKFRYVLVDEFQDTNPNQYELINLIAGKHKQITIVGDDDQAIYSWRGASIRFLFNFEEDFPGARIIKLEQNYRSTPQVLEFANDMITKNTVRRDKAMWTDKKEGNPVYVLNTRSKEDEASTAADFIIRLQEEKPDLFPVAVLYRINSQSLAFETEFSRRSINFKILKGQRFFDRKEVKDTLAMVKLAVNLDDDLSFLRVIDFLPLGIGAKSLESITTHAREKDISLFRALKEYVPDKYGKRDFFGVLFDINRKQDQLKVTHWVDVLLKRSGYVQILADKGEQDRVLNIKELVEFISKWEQENPGEGIAHLMDRISLDSGESKEKENDASVFMLTMHNAKGLEFPTVLVVGVNPTFMPFFMRKGKEELEEERRLLYVASTRAEKQLVLSVGGDKPSKFLTEINRFLYSNVFSVNGLFDYLTEMNRERLPETGIEPSKLEEKYLEHPVFGRGKVINSIDKEKYIVDFGPKGEKTIDTSIVPVKFL